MCSALNSDVVVVSNSSRKVKTENGLEVTFTERGGRGRGFVRIKGRTVTGYRMGDTFYADFALKNAELSLYD